MSPEHKTSGAVSRAMLTMSKGMIHVPQDEEKSPTES